jgi:lipopolysaccharide cholinephosphotransferase
VKDIHKVELYMLKQTVRLCEKCDIPYVLYVGTALGAVRHGNAIPWDPDADIAIPYDYVKKFISLASEDAEFSENLYIYSYLTDEKCTRLSARVGFKGERADKLHVDIFPLVGCPEEEKEREKFLEELNRVKREYHIKQNRPVFHKNILKQCVLRIKRKWESFMIQDTAGDIVAKFEHLCEEYPYSKSRYVVNAYTAMGEKGVLLKEWVDKYIYMRYADQLMRVPAEYDKMLRHMYDNYMEYPDIEYRNEILNNYCIEMGGV